MVNPTTNTAPTNASSSMAILRRRDKRRQLTSSAIDVRDPFEIVALAVRYDESRQEETLLTAALEGGRLYDIHQFTQALEYLYRKTRAPSRLSPHKRSWRTGWMMASAKSREDPSFALTPIILSGLLTAIQEQREEMEQSGDLVERDMSSELVGACQTMRQAALARVRFHKKRNRVQRIVLPLLSVFVLIIIYLRTLAKTRNMLLTLGFVHSCDKSGDAMLGGDSDGNNEHYSSICRLSEAALWTKYREYLLTLDKPCHSADGRTAFDDSLHCSHPLLDQRYFEAPFSMHTALSRQLIRFEELTQSNNRRSSSSPKSLPRLFSSRPMSDMNPRWLGETTVNRAVRQSLDLYLPMDEKRSVLDVGCGVGGTLFSLLQMLSETATTRTATGTSTVFSRRNNHRFRYHGISLSGAEIHFAQRMVQHHGLDKDGNYDIRLEQRNYDRPLTPNTYTAIVAIESLSYSPNLEATLSNLIQALQTGGLLVVVDDVILGERKVTMNYEHDQILVHLYPHAYWHATLEKLGCKVLVARDLSLEYELTDLSYHLGWDEFSHWQILFAPLEAFVARLLYSHDSAAARVMQLTEDRRRFAALWLHRLVGFEDAHLAYNIYVCMKSN